MGKTQERAREIALLLPVIARRLLLDFFQTVDIPQAQMLTIMALSERAPCRLSDLAAKMRISAPTVTGLVDRLEKSGYARRSPDTDDRRVVNVDLTADGRKISEMFSDTLANRWEEILAKIKIKDQEDFIRVLKEMIAQLS